MLDIKEENFTSYNDSFFPNGKNHSY